MATRKKNVLDSDNKILMVRGGLVVEVDQHIGFPSAGAKSVGMIALNGARATAMWKCHDECSGQSGAEIEFAEDFALPDFYPYA